MIRAYTTQRISTNKKLTSRLVGSGVQLLLLSVFYTIPRCFFSLKTKDIYRLKVHGFGRKERMKKVEN